MPGAKRRPGHSYSVYVALYASEEVKAMVERREEDFTQPGRILAHVFYSGTSQASAMNNPLAFEVVMQRDSQTIIKVKVVL